MSFCDLGPKYSLWQRLRRCLLHDQTRAALTAALSENTDKRLQRQAVLAAMQAYEKRALASTRQTVSRMLDSIMAYLQRLLAPGLPWELKRSQKGLGLHAKQDCTLTLPVLSDHLGRAEIVELTEAQWQRESADPKQHCLIQSCGKVGVVIGPPALLNKPCSGSAPHLLLCNLPSVSALERLKKKRRTLQQNVTRQQQQQQQHKQATRSSGEQPLSFEQKAAAEGRSRADLTIAAGKRKQSMANKTLLSRDRLLPQVSLRLHSSYKSGCLHMSSGDELLLGYGTAYGAFENL